MAKRQPITRRTKKRQPDEFDRFEKLTKALVSVPKDEIDKKRAKDNRRKRPR